MRISGKFSKFAVKLCYVMKIIEPPVKAKNECQNILFPQI